MIQLETGKEPLLIFQIYAPDSSYPDKDKDEFYNILQQEITKLPRKCRFILMGDFNGTGNMNENGKRLLQFCAINDLGIINTMYKHPTKGLNTWSSPDGKTHNQIDFIITSNKQRRLFKNCRVYNSADIFSDHSLIMAKYYLNLPKKKHFVRTPKKYDVEKLNNKELASDFEIRLGGAFEPLLNSNLELEELYDDLNVDLKYADDTTLISVIYELLQLSTSQLEAACRKFGMKVNADKSKIMSEDIRNISIDGVNLEKVDSFVLLGSQVPSTSKDVRRRIALAATAFGNMRETIWTRKDIGRAIKLRLFNALILPIATYACETWSLTKEDSRALTVFENNCLRSILGIKRTDRISIKQIHQMAGTKSNIEIMIRKRRLTWFGHVCRLPDSSKMKKAMKGDFQTKRGRERPPKRWSDLVKEDTSLPFATAEKYAKDRLKWRRLVNTKWCKASDGVCLKVK